MAITTQSDVFNPEILTEAVQGVFAQKTAFMGSRLSSLGIVIVQGTMPIQGSPKNAIGTTITVPYFGTLGEFANNPDGSSATPAKLAQVTETDTVTRDSLAFEVSQWAQGNAAVNPNVGDPYEESARQILAAAERAMDKRLITAAAASGVYAKDVYSSTVPIGLTYDLCIDAKFEGWGDEQDDIGAILVHSQTNKDLLKLKDSTGRNLLTPSQNNGGPLDTFCGIPVVVSDRVPITGSTMGAVAASGTTPPTVTLAGTPLGAWKLQIDVVTGGSSNGTATFRFSTDNGSTWSSTYTIPSGGGAFVLDDSLTGAVADINSKHPADSLVGVNGKTGITATFANGTYNADNLYTSSASLKAMSMLLKKRSLAFWYSAAHLGLKTFQQIMSDSDQGAMHLYGVAHRYRRLPGGTKPGVIQITHNVTGY
jgi:capsid protein